MGIYRGSWYQLELPLKILISVLSAFITVYNAAMLFIKAVVGGWGGCDIVKSVYWWLYANAGSLGLVTSTQGYLPIGG